MLIFTFRSYMGGVGSVLRTCFPVFNPRSGTVVKVWRFYIYENISGVKKLAYISDWAEDSTKNRALLDGWDFILTDWTQPIRFRNNCTVEVEYAFLRLVDQ